MELDGAAGAGLIVAAALLASTAQTVTGFGLALLLVPPATLVLRPADAVAVALVLLIPSNALLVLGEGRCLDRTAASRLLAGAAIGLPVGMLAIRAASPDALRLALAVAVVMTVVIVVTGRPSLGRGTPTLLAAGVLTGALTTSLTANGPPTVLALQGRGVSPPAFRATVGVVLGASAVVGVLLFALDGRLDGDVPRAVALAVPAQLVGWRVGLLIRPRVPANGFRLAVLALLLVGAASTALAALT
ncbi:MAG: sulfite exporter TauE/SafE family protein [Actinomycetota bacterium]